MQCALISVSLFAGSQDSKVFVCQWYFLLPRCLFKNWNCLSRPSRFRHGCLVVIHDMLTHCGPGIDGWSVCSGY
jgi:hypothetical protein